VFICLFSCLSVCFFSICFKTSSIMGTVSGVLLDLGLEGFPYILQAFLMLGVPFHHSHGYNCEVSCSLGSICLLNWHLQFLLGTLREEF